MYIYIYIYVLTLIISHSNVMNILHNDTHIPSTRYCLYNYIYIYIYIYKDSIYIYIYRYNAYTWRGSISDIKG